VFMKVDAKVYLIAIQQTEKLQGKYTTRNKI